MALLHFLRHKKYILKLTELLQIQYSNYKKDKKELKNNLKKKSSLSEI